MSLGAAIAVAFIVLILVVVGMIFLVIWLHRVCKRNEAAAKAFNILAAFPAVLIIGILGWIYFVFPPGLSEDHPGMQGCSVFAVQGDRVYMFAKEGFDREISFGYFNRKSRTFTPVLAYPEDKYRSPQISSLAWDGKQMVFTVKGDRNYLVLFRNDSAFYINESDDEFFVSRDVQTNEYLLASDDWPYHMCFSRYDSNMKLLDCDTFYMDEDTKDFDFSPQAIQYLNKTWYANGENKTYKLEFSHDTGRYVPVDGNGITGYDLFGSLTGSGSCRWLLTEKGIQSTGLPDKNHRSSFFGQNSYYKLYPDSMSWRFLMCAEDDHYQNQENYFCEGNILFHESESKSERARIYEVKYPGAEPVQMKIFDKYAGTGISYSSQMVFVSKDSLEVYYSDFSRYAIFNTLSGKRIEEGDRKSALTEWIRDGFLLALSGFALVCSLLWLCGIIFCRIKKTNRFIFIPMYSYSLILFFNIGIPYLVLLFFNLLD